VFTKKYEEMRKETKTVSVRMPVGDYKQLLEAVKEKRISVSDHILSRMYTNNGTLAGLESERPKQEGLSGMERKRQIAIRVKEKRAAARARKGKA